MMEMVEVKEREIDRQDETRGKENIILKNPKYFSFVTIMNNNFLNSYV